MREDEVINEVWSRIPHIQVSHDEISQIVAMYNDVIENPVIELDYLQGGK